MTDAQKTMAEHWADGPSSETPPGHWRLFAQFVSARDRNTLDENMRMFFATKRATLRVALCDVS